jgi:hypothetical protein
MKIFHSAELWHFEGYSYILLSSCSSAMIIAESKIRDLGGQSPLLVMFSNTSYVAAMDVSTVLCSIMQYVAGNTFTVFLHLSVG